MPSAASSTAAAPGPPRRDRDRRILPAALAMSVLLHVILIALLRFMPGGAPEDDMYALTSAPPRPSSGLELVPMRIVPDGVAVAEPAARVETTRPAPVQPAPEQHQEEQRAAPQDEFERALEALRPRIHNPRLFGGQAADLATPDERAALRVYARMRAWNDSIAMEAERARNATDWTFTDSEGRRWGFSPGKIHLGNLELPMPLAFSPPPGQRDLIRARTLEWEAIQGQADRGRITEEFNDRVRAIRARIDAERAEE